MREPKKQKRCLNCIDRRIALMRKKRYLLKPLRSFTPDGSIAFENAVMNALSFDSKDRTQTMEKNDRRTDRSQTGKASRYRMEEGASWSHPREEK